MILYHGTNLDIQSIDLALFRPYKDFGRGFYTTEIFEQAQKMAKRVAKIYGGTPIVNVYETTDDFFANRELHIMDFGNVPTEKWAVFVMNNRNFNKRNDISGNNESVLIPYRAGCKVFKEGGGFIMTKQEQLMEYNIQDIIEYMVKDLMVEYDKAMVLFYNSQTFDKLTDAETGLYLESSAYVYGLFQDERNFGNLIQAEI